MFLSGFVMGKEVISRHRAAAGCLHRMHGPDHSGGRKAVPVPVWSPGIFRNMQRAQQNGHGCRKRLKVKNKRLIYFHFDLLYFPVMEVYSHALRKLDPSNRNHRKPVCVGVFEWGGGGCVGVYV